MNDLFNFANNVTGLSISFMDESFVLVRDWDAGSECAYWNDEQEITNDDFVQYVTQRNQ